MNEQPHQPARDYETTELITSYLDGELSDEQRIAVEHRLTQDVDFRTELQQLQKTWDLLDEIPRYEPKTSFTQSTLELVVKDATREASRQQSKSSAWPLRIAALLVVPLVAFLLASFLTDFFQNADHRQLVNDLPLIENLYYYETAENFNLLISLQRSEQFSDSDPWQELADEQTQIESELGLLNSNFKQREAILASYDPDQLVQLKRKKTKFENLSEEELGEIRAFHQRLKHHADREELQRILVRYYNWLKSLDEVTRTEIMDLPANDRKARIRSIKTQQAERLFGLVGSTALPDEDKKFVLDWVNLIVDSKREQIKRLNLSEYRKKLDQIRRGEIKPYGRSIDRLLSISPEIAAELIFEDIESLKWGLSPTGLQIFMGRDEEEQKKLVAQWLRSARYAQRLVTNEDLIEFYERLPPERKEELNNEDAERRRTILHRELLNERDQLQRASRMRADYPYDL